MPWLVVGRVLFDPTLLRVHHCRLAIENRQSAI
jgi:hypothetical protein